MVRLFEQKRELGIKIRFVGHNERKINRTVQDLVQARDIVKFQQRYPTKELPARLAISMAQSGLTPDEYAEQLLLN